MMFRMPTSTAERVTMACLPWAPSTLTRTVVLVSGTVLGAASSLTSSLRSALAIGRKVRPSARAGVTRSPSLPGRNTAAAIYRSCRFQVLSTGILTCVPVAFTATQVDHSIRSPSTVMSAWPSCGGVRVSLTLSPGLAGTPSSFIWTRSGRLPMASASCAFQPA
ncbi:hypothetical protein D9M68_703830 [compost metagenome]